MGLFRMLRFGSLRSTSAIERQGARSFKSLVVLLRKMEELMQDLKTNTDKRMYSAAFGDVVTLSQEFREELAQVELIEKDEAIILNRLIDEMDTLSGLLQNGKVNAPNINTLAEKLRREQAELKAFLNKDRRDAVTIKRDGFASSVKFMSVRSDKSLARKGRRDFRRLRSLTRDIIRLQKEVQGKNAGKTVEKLEADYAQELAYLKDIEQSESILVYRVLNDMKTVHEALVRLHKAGFAGEAFTTAVQDFTEIETKINAELNTRRSDARVLRRAA